MSPNLEPNFSSDYNGMGFEFTVANKPTPFDDLNKHSFEDETVSTISKSEEETLSTSEPETIAIYKSDYDRRKECVSRHRAKKLFNKEFAPQTSGDFGAIRVPTASTMQTMTPRQAVIGNGPAETVTATKTDAYEQPSIEVESVSTLKTDYDLRKECVSRHKAKKLFGKMLEHQDPEGFTLNKNGIKSQPALTMQTSMTPREAAMTATKTDSYEQPSIEAETVSALKTDYDRRTECASRHRAKKLYKQIMEHQNQENYVLNDGIKSQSASTMQTMTPRNEQPQKSEARRRLGIFKKGKSKAKGVFV